MKKPLIGVVPLWDEEKDSIWMLPGYLDGIELAGGLPVVLTLSTNASIIEQISRTIDGLLFTGGQDISPALYGEEKSEYCDMLCVKRDEMESALFNSAVMELDKPAFGICRGIQLFNALLGGKLYQYLDAQHRGIVWQNIIFALRAKAIVLVLGAVGIANMRAAAFADIGVAVIAILNAMSAMRRHEGICKS